MDMERSIEHFLTDFRKSLKEDGGDIELAGIADGIVKVRLSRTTVPVTFSRFLREHKTRKGIGCGRCRIPDSTIIAVLEAELKEKVLGVRKVEMVKWVWGNGFEPSNSREKNRS